MSTPELRWMRPQLNEKARRTALATISNAERERYDAAPAGKQSSFLAGRLLLRRLVSELTGVEPSSVDLVALCPDCGGSHGKPALADSSLHLSLSRSEHAVVAAASWDSPVGIDIESLDQPAAALSAIGALTGDDSLVRWTRIEAVLKADGRGLRVDPGEVSIDEIEGELVGRVADSPVRYRLSEVELAPNVRVSVAVALNKPGT